jgi:integrase
MPGRRAKILSIADVGDLLAFASCTRHPLRNAVIVLLSAKAGLRAGKIANLTWDMVVDANGHISGSSFSHRRGPYDEAGRKAGCRKSARHFLAALSVSSIRPCQSGDKVWVERN